MGDRPLKRYAGRRGEHEAVETEALSLSLIVELLERRLDELLPDPLEKVRAREALQRAAVGRSLR